MTTSPIAPDRSAEDAHASWPRLLALSGAAFALLFVVGWFTNGGLTPHYDEPNQAWTNWARDNQSNGRISAFLMLLAGFAFLYFMGIVRRVSAARSPRFTGLDHSRASRSAAR
jgi:hypothetical protein